MTPPQVQITDVTPIALEAQWTDINSFVDSWIVSIERTAMETINGEQDEENLIKV